MFLGKTVYSHSTSPLRFMGTSKFNAGGYSCDGLASHPGGSRYTHSCYMLLKPWGSDPMSYLARMQTLPYLIESGRCIPWVAGDE